MSSGALVGLFEQTMLALLSLAGPILVASLAVGLVVSIIQAATQINEATLTFLPKLLVATLIIVVAGPWMMDQLLGFTRSIFDLSVQVTK
jgi:flagellar biosynthetic protein FliQ